ncbi:protein unc-13 homolog C [Exaiptasia diaphana]|uniref:Uncharacterized protein n=1 Tax=Exaiptasia diaphana TaxID=2652724 RepID=A0A913XG48_EXADI|nr:protein unc-13 homolog C [Exaiptasia diaphana]
MAGRKKAHNMSLNESQMSTPIKPNAKKSKTEIDDPEIDLKKLYNLVLEMNKKLDKLEGIERHVKRINKDIRDLKNSCQYAHDSIEEVQKEQNKYKGKMKALEERLEKIEDENKKIKQSTVNLRARSMRNNLLFFNIEEKDQENCEDEIKNIVEQIGMEPWTVEIERSHRMGKRREEKPRPIVAKFLRWQDKERVRKSAYKLKGTKIGIAEQFPMEIEEKRKELYPILKLAKKEGKKAKIVRDQLFIDGQ